MVATGRPLWDGGTTPFWPELVWGFPCQGVFIGVSFPASVSITAVAAWRHDCGKRIEVEFGDLAQSFGGATVAEAVGQGLVPVGILGLQREQFGDGGPPALRSGAAIRRPAVADHRELLLGLVASAVACLSLSVAEGMLTFRLATSWHVPFSVTQQNSVGASGGWSGATICRPAGVDQRVAAAQPGGVVACTVHR